MPGFRNYGPNVSENPQSTTTGGQFSSEDRSYESVVVQEDAPVIDWEMNLRADVLADQGARLAAQRESPTCFLNADFLERSDLSGSYSFLAAVPGNESKFSVTKQDLIVNGWNVRFDYSASAISGINNVVLPAPPLAGSRTDLVVLEVWRALVLPAPSIANKSATGLICRLGNVKAPDAVNLTDDLIDPVFGAPSNARVQIQYRFRVIPGVNLFSYPDGLDDPAVISNTVSDFTGPGADGSPSGSGYAPVPGDSGLWSSGSNTAISAALFGTADGMMYATPICAVFRRNSTAFDRSTNMNGAALIAAVTSDRPDGLFADQVVAGDVVDLRRGVARDFRDVLNKAAQQVFANEMTTSPELSSVGTAGTSMLFRDDLGLSTHPGNPDRVRRFFSDRVTIETVVARFDIVAPLAFVNFDLSLLRVNWEGSSINMLGISPANIFIQSVGAIRGVVAGTSDTDLIGSGDVSSVVLSVNVGPGVDRATINFAAPLGAIQIYAELVIVYPGGNGLSRNVVEAEQVWTPGIPSMAIWVDGGLLTATSDPNRFSLINTMWNIDAAHRELFIRLRTSNQIRNIIVDSNFSDTLYIPEFLTGAPININDGINAPYNTTNYARVGGYTIVTLTGGVPAPSGTVVSVTYKAYRPLPVTGAFPGDSYQVFYDTRAVQSVQPPAGNQTLRLVPRTDPDSIYSIGIGSGSPDTGYPFPSPSAQVPIGALPSANFPEALLDGPGTIAVTGFTAPGGLLRLPSMLPYAPNPGEVTLFKSAPDTVTDADGRNFWPLADDGLPSHYPPSAAGPSLLFGRKHKAAVPVLMELKEDFPSVGRKGTMVLMLVTSWSDFDPANAVAMASIPTFSAAGIFRVRGRMMNSRRPDY